MENEDIFDMKEIEELIGGIKANIVQISDEKDSAIIELVEPPEGQEYTEQDIIDLLNQYGVISGILHDVIKQILMEKKYYVEIEVAAAKTPIDGVDGKYVYHFNEHPHSAPKLLEDGSVDYRDMQLFEPVTKGQLIAEYIPPTPGIDGMDVCGNVIPCKNGKNLPILRGKHIYRSEDDKQFFSDIDGRIELDDEGKVTISDVFLVKSDVDASTGNIKFDGNVEIWGNVVSGFRVDATGNVNINGMVEAAIINAGKDVIIKNGMNANGKGFVIAGGNVEGRYFEHANIECGGHLYANSIMNCFIQCKDEVVISGNRGVLLSGRIHALKGIVAVNIGNSVHMPTYVKAGLEPKMLRQYEEKRKNIDIILRELEKITKLQKALESVKVTEEKKDEIEEQKKKIVRTKISQKSRLESLKKECAQLEFEIEVGKTAKVTVSHWVYGGTSITINGATNNIKEDVKNITFSLRKGNVVMNYND